MIGATLNAADSYVIPPPHKGVLLPAALGVLLPPGSVIALEATRFDDEVERLLQPYVVPPKLIIRPGTGWPKSRWIHFKAQAEALHVFEDLIRRIESPVLSNHLYACSEGELLLEWHDAFTNDPIRVSRRLPQASIVAFCCALGVKPPAEIPSSK